MGNVLVTISDNRVPVDDGTYEVMEVCESCLPGYPCLGCYNLYVWQNSTADGVVDRYTAVVITANDYYPFGMLMPGRKYSSDGSYRYGFNGQEISTEIDPNGNSMTAEFWQYDARIGKRWNPDPKPNNALSIYSAYENSPIWRMDILGDTSVPSAPVGFAVENQRVGYKKKEELNLSYSASYSVFLVVDGKGQRFLTKEEKYSVKGYGRTDWRTRRYYWSERPQAVGADYSTDAHWIPYLDPGQEANAQAKEVTNILLGGLAISAGIIVAGPAIITNAPSVGLYLAPKPGYNPSGAAWDLINQTIFQGRSLDQVNWGSTFSAGSFGGGNILSNALWGSSGSFTDFSYKNLSNGGSPFNINKKGAASFASNFTGNLFDGGSGYFFTSFNKTVISNSSVRAVVNETLNNTMSATGQGISNVMEENFMQNK